MLGGDTIICGLLTWFDRVVGPLTPLNGDSLSDVWPRKYLETLLTINVYIKDFYRISISSQ